jgi:DNA-binding winged helix-turn-helix (wHTH) protein
VTKVPTYRFGPCELDPARRSLSAHGRELKLQPRVFDLLCYLVQHRDRVVSKDELLDALWPGTVVVDNALQRVVSLARSALADIGLCDAVRTYSRHGYRFCVDDCAEESVAAAEPSVAVADARAAFDRSDWVAACEDYAAAEALSPLAPDDVEQWGRAAICCGLGPTVVDALERAVALRDAEGDTLSAARATLLLVQIRIEHRQGAMARGLLQRVSRYLNGKTSVVERGQFAWMASRIAIANGDAELALQMADEACSLGRALRDPDIECLGLVYRGHALIYQGEVASGLAQHDEAAAVIRLGRVRSWVAGWALCSILYATRYRCDWLRASQFAELFDDWCGTCRMPAFPGTCQLHRAAVLEVQGDLERAAAEVQSAATLLAQAAPWAEGDAYCVLGDIQLSIGDFAGAEASFKHAHALGWDPQPGLARLHLMTGRPELARRGIERNLEEAVWPQRERRGQLLCLLVHASLAGGDVDRAREALQILAADTQLLATDALKAMHCCAEAELALHDREFKRASQQLRRAIRLWREVGSPVGEAEARMRLAECLILDCDAEGTELELHALESNLARVVTVHRARLNAVRQALAGLCEGTPLPVRPPTGQAAGATTTAPTRSKRQAQQP